MNEKFKRYDELIIECEDAVLKGNLAVHQETW